MRLTSAHVAGGLWTDAGTDSATPMQFADQLLAQRLEAIDLQSNAAYAAAKAAFAPESRSCVLAVGDGVALYAGSNSPISRVHGLGMQQAVDATQLDAAEAFFGARGVATNIDLCPLAHPSLLHGLRSRQYSVLTFKHVWWRTLQAHPHGFPGQPETRARVRVELVTSATARLWAQVVATSFAGSSNVEQADIDIPGVIPYKANTVCFLAWIGDEAAGGGALSMHDGTAICYSTSVRPGLRRLGIQTALLNTRLDHARDQGCDLAVIQTTPGSASQRNVQRHGFQLAYTKPTMTLVQPTST